MDIKDIAQLIMSGFPALSTGNICDAGRGSVRIMAPGIKPLHHEMKVAGPVYTVDTPPGANLSLHEAFATAPAGCVLVINANSDMTSGHFGDLMVTAAQTRGVLGIIIDGAIRDVEDIMQMGFPVFARGSYPHGNTAKKSTFNQPIQCGGVLVNPGDIVFADATGIVIIPSEKVQEVYENAKFIANSELGFVQQLNEGKTLMQIPDFLKMHNIDPIMLQTDGISTNSN